MVETLFSEESTIRDSSNTGTKQEGLKNCTHLVEAQHLDKSNYCTQSRRAVKSKNTLPVSNTRRRMTRAMRRFFRDANYFRIQFDSSI